MDVGEGSYDPLGADPGCRGASQAMVDENDALDRDRAAQSAAQREMFMPDPTDHILQFFEYEHLPHDLKQASLPFCKLAIWVSTEVPRNPERTVALRKLLEAKDAAVRACLAARRPEPD